MTAFRVQTRSGSIYLLSEDGWKRIGRVPILGAEDVTEGPGGFSAPTMGQGMLLPLDDGSFIHTTPVVEAEVTSEID